MLRQVPLETTKYLAEAVDRQYLSYKKQKSQVRFRNFVVLLSAIACFMIGLLFAQQLPHWYPIFGV